MTKQKKRQLQIGSQVIADVQEICKFDIDSSENLNSKTLSHFYNNIMILNITNIEGGIVKVFYS